MITIGIFLLCVFCYFIGWQKGRNPHFFTYLFSKNTEKTTERKEQRQGKKRPKAPAEKIVSFQEYKQKRK